MLLLVMASLLSGGRSALRPPSSEKPCYRYSNPGKPAEHLTMKITLIGHAAILVETRGVRILSDPWWQGPCFGAQWWPQSQPWLEPLSEAPPDFIYLSHGHGDHFSRRHDETNAEDCEGSGVKFDRA